MWICKNTSIAIRNNKYGSFTEALSMFYPEQASYTGHAGLQACVDFFVEIDGSDKCILI